MLYQAESIDEFLEMIPQDRKEAIVKLRAVIKNNLPEGFEEGFSDGFIHYSVPHSLFSPGYHVDGSPLPFVSIASQKHHIALYHMGVYASPKLLEWFEEAYKKIVPTKLDMGKSCLRMKNVNNIPYDLIGQLMTKMSVNEYIELYLHSRKP